MPKTFDCSGYHLLLALLSNGQQTGNAIMLPVSISVYIYKLILTYTITNIILIYNRVSSCYSAVLTQVYWGSRFG